MTRRLAYSLWVIGGACSLALANLAVRWEERKVPKPVKLSTAGLENALRVASQQQNYWEMEQ